MPRFALVPLVLAAACARAPKSDLAPSAVATPGPTATATATTTTATTTATTTTTATATTTATTTTTATATAADPPLEGEDFIAQTRVLFRVAACGPSGELPPRFDAAVVARHCEELGRAYDDYKKGWVDLAKPFLASIEPKNLPRRVVYPFGGGDLASALTTFPEATEITTISLEPAGDVRPIDRLGADHLSRELAIHRAHLERLFEKAHSRTDNLEKESRTELPGEILFALAALVVHGDEPVSLRYFRVRSDGAVSYVTREDLDAAARKPRDLHALLENVELRFRSAAASGAPVQVLRHISFNLDDFHMKADGSLLAYLNETVGEKGKVAAMTKAASHLLWNDHFALIRGWLLDHTDWMVSDSTGVPPRFAQPSGFVQETYGTFAGPAPFGLLDARDADDFKHLFLAQPPRDLPFRYGYPDSSGHAHLIVTRRK